MIKKCLALLASAILISTAALPVSAKQYPTTANSFNYMEYECKPGTMENTKTYWQIKSTRVMSKSGLTADELRKGLIGELQPFAEDFLRIEREYGINAVFFAAICATESGWGAYPVSKNNYMSWTTDTIYYYEFDTPYECFEYGAKRLVSTFLHKDGACYNGDYIRDINICYAINPDNTINWVWHETVTDVVYGILQRAYTE